jgi:crotonobetainyl-CoA:carnitine CoA-transferase CaiB-like acyl-CoA transferase
MTDPTAVGPAPAAGPNTTDRRAPHTAPRADRLGHVRPRTGDRSAGHAPRDACRTADGSWVAVPASWRSVADRVSRLVGRTDATGGPRCAPGAGRDRHTGEPGAAVGGRIARHDPAETLAAASEKAEAAVPPAHTVHAVHALSAGERYRATCSITEVPDGEPRTARMRHVRCRLSGIPGAIRWAGRPHGADRDEAPTALGPAGPGAAGPSAAGAR